MTWESGFKQTCFMQTVWLCKKISYNISVLKCTPSIYLSSYTVNDCINYILKNSKVLFLILVLFLQQYGRHIQQ